MNSYKRYVLTSSVACVFALLAAGCSGDDDDNAGAPAKDAGTDAQLGEPITADKFVWTDVSFPDTKCRDGSPAGIRVSLNPDSPDLMIYLEGGGACSNAWSCSPPANPANLAATKSVDTTGKGILNRDNPANPVKDWNWVFVPYCTGDVHGGDNPAGDPGGNTGPQAFEGYANLRAFLKRVVPTLPHVTRILHTGSSAGGFGAGLTSELVARAFPPSTKFILVDDSGPPMTADYVPKCLQSTWRTLWGFDKTVLHDCGQDCPDPGDYSVDWTKHLIKAHPNNYGGIISSARDAVISLFYGLGNDNCGGDPTAIPTPITPEKFNAGLMNTRSILQPLSSKFGMYVIDSTQHTWLTTDAGLYQTQVGGVKLVDWLTNLINEQSAAQVGP